MDIPLSHYLPVLCYILPRCETKKGEGSGRLPSDNGYDSYPPRDINPTRSFGMDISFDFSEEADEILSFINGRGITRLVHFTPLCNLVGIIKTGAILSKRLLHEFALEKNDPSIVDRVYFNDDQRLDNRTSYVNLSIERPNAYLFRRFVERAGGYGPWCVLSIDPRILEIEGCLFTVGNAANTFVRRYGTGTGVTALSRLFAPQIETESFSRGFEIAERWPGMPSSWTTDMQAEVLFPRAVFVSMIDEIILPTSRQAWKVQDLLSRECRGKDIPPVVPCPDDFPRYLRVA